MRKARKALVLGLVSALLLVVGLRPKPVVPEARAANGASSAFGSPAAKAHREEAEEMAETAQKAFEGTNAAYLAGSAPFAELYPWSRRWLEAERSLAGTRQEDLDALQAHWERMRKLYLKIDALHGVGGKGGEGEKFYAAAYYLAEAEFWLAAARDPAPGKPE